MIVGAQRHRSARDQNVSAARQIKSLSAVRGLGNKRAGSQRRVSARSNVRSTKVTKRIRNLELARNLFFKLFFFFFFFFFFSAPGGPAQSLGQAKARFP